MFIDNRQQDYSNIYSKSTVLGEIALQIPSFTNNDLVVLIDCTTK